MTNTNADNRTIVHSFFERLNARDFDGAGKLLTADCVHHTTGLGGGDLHGRAAWRNMASGLWFSFPDRIIRVQQIIAEGDRVAVRLTWRGTQKGEFAHMPATGREVEVNGISVFRMQDGRIAEQWIEQDILALLQQLGAAPGHSDNWRKP